MLSLFIQMPFFKIHVRGVLRSRRPYPRRSEPHRADIRAYLCKPGGVYCNTPGTRLAAFVLEWTLCSCQRPLCHFKSLEIHPLPSLLRLSRWYGSE